MKAQYDALVARAEEFKAFVEGYSGPEQDSWSERIAVVTDDLNMMREEIYAE